jgi:short subunit dehydrogenase-like uncharacterized protein
MSLLIYGATGYTGQLISTLACERGLAPILAGRDRTAVRALAESLGAQWRVATLDDARAMDALLDGVRVVLHCAGPFVHTSRLMVDACLRHRVHYLDITGEIGVFEACAARDQAARDAGIVLMPGVGFDVVPSDCLAAHLAARLPDATSLALGFRALGGVSRGTALTMVEGLGSPGCIRVNGTLTPVPPAFDARTIDFGDGPRLAVTIPWGDVSTAFHSTGIPNIRVYMSMHPKQHAMLLRSRYLGWLLRQPWVKRRAAARIRARAPGPSASARASGVSLLWGEAVAPDGRVAVSRLRAPEGYTLTADTAVRFATRVMDGNAPTGFQTPSRAFGADCILEVPGVTRTDDPLSSAQERA